MKIKRGEKGGGRGGEGGRRRRETLFFTENKNLKE